MRLVDSHCHSTPTASRAMPTSSSAGRLAGVERILVPAGTSPRASALDSWTFPWLDAAVGVHPHDAAGRRRGWASGCAATRVVAIGETGLDYDRVFSPIDDQLATCAGTWPRPRDRQAGDPPLPLGGRPARRPGRAARGAAAMPAGRPRSGSGRRRSSTRFPARSTTAARSSTSGWRSASRGSSSGPARSRRPRSPRSSRSTGCSSRPIRRSSRHPARRARATSRSGSASQAAWLAERRQVDHRGARLLARRPPMIGVFPSPRRKP